MPSSCLHRGKEVVRLDCRWDSRHAAAIKRHGGRWSRTLNAWYLPRSKTLLEKLVRMIAASLSVNIDAPELIMMRRTLELKGYSTNTIRSYTGCFSLFLDFFYGGKDVAVLSKQDIEDYLLYLAKERKYSEGAIHSMVNSVKFYYEQVLGKQRELYQVERPRKPLQPSSSPAPPAPGSKSLIFTRPARSLPVPSPQRRRAA